MRSHTLMFGVNVDGDNREYKTIWYQVFEDCTAFAFYSNGCSLRECWRVSDAAWEYIDSLPDTTVIGLNMQVTPDMREKAWFLLMSDTLQHYAVEPGNIIDMARLMDPIRALTVFRMKDTKHRYAKSPDVVKAWKEYQELL